MTVNLLPYTMIKEILKRPFVRPLFIWIVGIILQINHSVQMLSFGLLIIPLVMIFVSALLCGKAKPEASYSMRWAWGSVFLPLLLFLSIQMTSYHERLPVRDPNGLEIKAREIQQKLLLPIDKMSLTEAEKSVLSALALGYQDTMPKEIRRQFSLTGVAHILAVSGFHVAVICGFISFFLSFLPNNTACRWAKYLLTLLLCWSFTVVSGLAPSAVRSAIMFSLYQTGRQLRRQTDSYNTMAASAFCMLVYDPFYLYDIGFQLSYIAVVFILYLHPKLNRLLYVRNPLLAKPWECLTVTLAAQVGVTFLCQYYFGQFSTVFLFTNLPLALIATILMPVSLLWLLLPAGLPGMGLLQSGIECLTHWMMQIVDVFSRIPGSSISFEFGFGSMLVGYLLLFLSFSFFYNKR